MKRPPNYDPEAVKPMWQELDAVGIKPLTEAEEVHQVLGNKEGSALLVINSVCGCAAGNARPGAMISLQYKKIPDAAVTVFAGMDHEAVDTARGYLNVAPSSPCIAVFKNGEPVKTLERRHIETMTAEQIANELASAYEGNCEKAGPSIPKEEFEKIVPHIACGSTIPTFSEE